MAIDRSEASRALAKAIAFKACGKQHFAEQWARRLVELLECSGILAIDRGDIDTLVRSNVHDTWSEPSLF